MSTRSGTHSALIIVDLQVGVVGRALQRDQTLANVEEAMRRARAASIPVIWVQHHDADLPRDSAEWQWVPELEALPHELRIHKSHNSSFEDTQLLAELDRLHVGRILLAGASTGWCIRATAYGALERGFDLTLLADCHTTKSVELAPGRMIDAQGVIDDLNMVMSWLSYPGRKNEAVPVAQARF